jgi:uncharacterized DUF497 family protein
MNYSCAMNFEWAEAKSEVCAKDRRFNFVYTPRHDVIRIISARKANQREVKHYENCTNED